MVLSNDLNNSSYNPLNDYSQGMQDYILVVYREMDKLFTKRIFSREQGKYNHLYEATVTPMHMGKNIT